MGNRIQLVAIVAAAMLFLFVLELVRRRRLMERYALLWLLATLVLIFLAAWRGGLTVISHAIGIVYPPNALFFVALGFVLLLLLHFSASVSRLADQTKVLAQRNALLEERLRRLEGASEGAGDAVMTGGGSDRAPDSGDHPDGSPSRQLSSASRT